MDSEPGHALGWGPQEIHAISLQVLEGDSGVYLKFVAKGESEPVDSPGELYVTVSVSARRHAVVCYACIRARRSSFPAQCAHMLLCYLLASHRGCTHTLWVSCRLQLGANVMQDI